MVVVDSCSTDRTLTLLRESSLYKRSPNSVKILQTAIQARGAKLKIGLENSSGERFLFHHPRSIPERDGIQYLIECDTIPEWGGFKHAFDLQHPLLRFTSFYSNHIRAGIKSIFYLDHCIFAEREILKKIEFPVTEIFEDTLLCLRLRKLTKGKLLPFISKTSAIRFEKNGIYFQAFINQLMKLGFFLKIPFPILNKIYERALKLNSK